jgi:hypothetical protein
MINETCFSIISYAFPPYTGPKNLLIRLQNLLDAMTTIEIIESVINKFYIGKRCLTEVVHMYDILLQPNAGTIENIKKILTEEIENGNIKNEYVALTVGQKIIADEAMNSSPLSDLLNLSLSDANQKINVKDAWKLVLAIYWNKIIDTNSVFNKATNLNWFMNLPSLKILSNDGKSLWKEIINTNKTANKETNIVWSMCPSVLETPSKDKKTPGKDEETLSKDEELLKEYRCKISNGVQLLKNNAKTYCDCSQTSVYLHLFSMLLLEMLEPIQFGDSKFVEECKMETADKIESITSILYAIFFRKEGVITDYDRLLLKVNGLNVEKFELQKDWDEKDDLEMNYNLRGFLSKNVPHYVIKRMLPSIIKLCGLAFTIKGRYSETKKLKEILNEFTEGLRKSGCQKNITTYELLS